MLSGPTWLKQNVLLLKLGMITHLKKNHVELYTAFVQQSDEKKQQPTQRKTTQLSLKESTEKKQKYNKDHPRRKAIDLKIMECIAVDNQPFYIV